MGRAGVRGRQLWGLSLLRGTHCISIWDKEIPFSAPLRDDKEDKEACSSLGEFGLEMKDQQEP